MKGNNAITGSFMDGNSLKPSSPSSQQDSGLTCDSQGNVQLKKQVFAMQSTRCLGNKIMMIESIKLMGEGEGDTKCCSRNSHHSTSAQETPTES